tara:strand:- start:33935 stop:34099 length:165 start_codon:yes stop_codon:yes gene_type:complete
MSVELMKANLRNQGVQTFKWTIYWWKIGSEDPGHFTGHVAQRDVVDWASGASQP